VHGARAGQAERVATAERADGNAVPPSTPPSV
jgi:hypothetical protein